MLVFTYIFLMVIDLPDIGFSSDIGLFLAHKNNSSAFKHVYKGVSVITYTIHLYGRFLLMALNELL